MDRKNQVQYEIIVPRDNDNVLKATSPVLKSSTHGKSPSKLLYSTKRNPKTETPTP